MVVGKEVVGRVKVVVGKVVEGFHLEEVGLDFWVVEDLIALAAAAAEARLQADLVTGEVVMV